MKLSVTTEAADDSSDGGSTSNPYSPLIQAYSTERVSRVLEEYLREIFPASDDYDSAEVSMSFMSPEDIRSLNRDYRDTDEATDVLSFPMDTPEGFPVLMLGDIVICPEEVSRLHPELSQSEGICLMIAHSFLHLLGWDHDTDEKQSAMWAKQDEISRSLMGVIE